MLVVGAAFQYRTYVFEKLSSGWSQTAVLGGEGSPPVMVFGGDRRRRDRRERAQFLSACIQHRH